ncbi:histone-like nucleoid-structuring protein Lsr2 [Aeromicrobium sp. A1-2]|uniref:tyrosine-type recombinase/integrase n=1 Tax=Aeromicrobium sp. A1-2 TaxID=2107713 RepID=UPI0013C36CC3|nr:histone-like nucleoid-structuring protein Lsr2 [Aeromicrobium sp. A1-2]
MTTTSKPSQGAQNKRRKAPRRAFGTVRQLSSGRWQARWEDSRGRTHSGPQTFESQRHADDWLTTVRADLVRGVWRSPDLGSATLATFMAQWIDQRTDLALSTREGYRTALARWIDRELMLEAPRGGKAIGVHLGAQPLNALSPATIREWYAAAHSTQVRERIDRSRNGQHRHAVQRQPTAPIRAWGRSNGWKVAETGRLPANFLDAWQAADSPGAPHAPASPAGADLSGRPAAVVVQAYRYLRACLNAALDDGLITANPCRVKRGGLVVAAERPHATPDEVRALCAAMPPRFAEAVDVAAWSALRAGELFALARRHVDLDAGTITVERALIDVAGHPRTFGSPKTVASLRTVALPSSVVQRLSDHMEVYTAEGPDALVFAHADGTSLSRDQRGQMFDRARRTVGRPDLRWHDLRHTGATLAARAGASIRELQHRLGHSTFAAAMRYQHASADRDRELAERLDVYAAADQPGNATVLRLA